LTGYGETTIIDACRAVCTVRFEGAVYALDAFQKKSKKGIATSKADLDRIQARLKRAEQMHGEWLKEREGNGKAKG
jgi:phage-related protein